MGIRFRCHQCGHELHVKDFQGGKRSKCPVCETKFRIPQESAERSIPLDDVSGGQSAALNLVIPDESSPEESTAEEFRRSLEKLELAATAAPVGTLNAKKSAGSYQASAPAELLESAQDAEAKQQDAREPSADDDAVAVQQEEAAQMPQQSQPVAPTSLQPQAICEAPTATWYVRPPAGGQYGPAPASVFCEWLAENRVTGESLVWRDGWPQWLVASEVFADYFRNGAAPEVPAPQPPEPPISPGPAARNQPAPSGVEQVAAPEFVAPLSLSERALAARKRQRKKNYLIMIGVLTTIAIGLVIALVVVLLQYAPSSPKLPSK